MEELQITQELGRIKYDFAPIKGQLAKTVEEYKGMIFTEDSIDIAKKERASINKQKKDFDDRVKEIKKEWGKPLEDFLAEAKEVSGMFSPAIEAIDAQLKDFEEKRIAEKKELIEQIYAENVPDCLLEIIPLERIYNSKWENKTTSKKAIGDEIEEIALSASKAVEAIKSMKSDMEGRAISLYTETLDLGQAMAYLSQYEKQKAEILEREKERARQQEEERIRAEERAKIEAEQRQAEDLERAKEEAKTEAVEALIPDDEGQEATQHTYLITLTEDAKTKLEMYMDSVGIEYGELVF